MKKIPPSDMLEVRAKVAALTALSRQRKDWGVSRAWERDYLANVSPEKRCSALRGRVYKKRRGELHILTKLPSFFKETFRCPKCQITEDNSAACSRLLDAHRRFTLTHILFSISHSVSFFSTPMLIFQP